MARYGLKHGMHKTRVYKSWQSMKQRCDNPTDPSYHRYGGRGISYCSTWRYFEHFFMAMGDRPEGTTLDRVDNNKNYTEDNCTWSTPKQQSRNRSDNRIIEYKGISLCFLDWCKALDIKRTTLSNRLKRGWSVERAFTTAVRNKHA